MARKFKSMYLGQNATRARLAEKIHELAGVTTSDSKRAACEEYLKVMNDTAASKGAAAKLIAELEKDSDCPYSREILADREFLAKKSMRWIRLSETW